MSLSNRDFRIGEWLVQPSLSRIGNDVASRHVAPRAMAVLVFLADARGAVVRRNAILDAVWPNMDVSPDALTQCIVELRKALGDSARNPTYIETIPKNGLRLLTAVSTDDSPVASARLSASRSSSAGGGRILAVVGVLAIAGAAFLGWLQSASRSDADLTHSPAPSAEIETPPLRDISTDNAKALDAYMTGNELSTNRDNPLNALPMAVRFYEIATREDPMFSLAWVRLGSTHARMYWYGVDRTPARLVLAEQAIRRALEIRPAAPDAHMALGDLYYRRGEYRAALTQFEIVEPLMAESAELYFLRASVQRRLGDWDGSIRDFEQAVELEPRNVSYLRQLHITRLFRREYAQASAALDRILAIAPDDPTAHVDRIVLSLCRDGSADFARRYATDPPVAGYDVGLARTYTSWLSAIFAREYEAALDVLDQAREEWIFDGDLRNSSSPKSLLYARTHDLLGDRAEAQALFAAVKTTVEERLAAGAEDDVSVRSALHLSLAEAEAALGDSEKAMRSMQRARDLLPKSQDQLLGSAVQLASVVRVLARMADHELLVRELEDYLAGPGHWSLRGLLSDPRLDPIRTDPQFQEMLRGRELVVAGTTVD